MNVKKIWWRSFKITELRRNLWYLWYLWRIETDFRNQASQIWWWDSIWSILTLKELFVSQKHSQFRAPLGYFSFELIPVIFPFLLGESWWFYQRCLPFDLQLCCLSTKNNYETTMANSLFCVFRRLRGENICWWYALLRC